jgi:iron complex outermembrane receptor protein
MLNMQKLPVGRTVASIVAIAWATAAAAQTADTVVAPTSASGASSGLDEIVVTAQKRAENVQDVAASITALGAEALENRQIRDITDLQQIVPSLVVGQGYGANLITLRGISTGITSGAEDPSVAVHINGVYQPRSRSLDAVLQDLDRVEVLAGPQGTLYGRNATGGVVNYLTKGPTKEFEGYVTGTVANYDRYAVRGGISGPLGEHAGFRIGAIYDDQNEGFTKNLTPNAPRKSVEDNRVAGVHGTLRLEPTSNLTLDLDGFYLDAKSSVLQAPFEFSTDPVQFAAFAPQEIRPHKTRSLQPSRLDTKYWQLSATTTWDMTDNVSLKHIVAYQNYKNDMNIDYDGSAVDALSTRQVFESRTIQSELDLSVAMFDDRLTSIYGVYYFNDDLSTASRSTLGYGFGAANLLQPLNLTFPFSQKARSFAFFTDQTFKVTDRFRLIGGLRFNRDRKSAERSGQVDEFGPGSICATTAAEREWNSLTPKVGAQFDATETIMLYGQWQKGFKSGGFPANSCSPGYDPEKIKGPEIGIKSDLFDRRLRLNIAAYYYDYENLQVQKVDANSNFFVQNAAAARIKGIEFSAQGLISDAFRVDMSGNLQSAKYTNFVNCNTAAFLGACTGADPRPAAAQLQNVAGNPLNRAPSYTLNVGAEYTVAIGNFGDLLFRGESYWSGSVQFDEFKTRSLTQSAYSVQNAYVTFTPTSDRYQVRAFIKNLTDEKYKVSGLYAAYISSGGGNWAAPRTFGGEVTVKF